MPTHLEDLTYDQLMVLAIKKSLLKSGFGVAEIDVDELRALGKVPAVAEGQPRSLAQRIRAKKQEEQKQPSARELKRQRRKEYGESIKAARARGEKI